MIRISLKVIPFFFVGVRGKPQQKKKEN